MKTALLALALLFLLAFTAAADEPEAVLDTSGNRLDNNLRYYILSATDCSCCNESGIALAVPGRTKCPFDVYVQCEAQKVSILPTNYYHTNDVQVSTIVNIVHSRTRCEPLHWVTLWKLGQYDSDAGKAFLTTEGTVNDPVPRSNKGFKIDKYGSNYKIVYCDTECRDIGIYFDKDGNKRLFLSDVPYPVKFQKA